MPTLSVTKLSQFVGKKQILSDISFTASSGQIIALLGPNGAGKTTFLKTIIGLIAAPTAHEKDQLNCIKLDNHLINKWPIHQKVSHGLIYLPQHSSLFQHMSVLDNLELVYEYQDCWKGKSKDAFNHERDKWLEQTHLEGTINQMATTLSGGQKRKLELIRSLLMHPQLIMLDEPFAGVDPKSIYELKNIFIDMAARGIGIIISDHHVDQLLSMAKLVYVIMQGKVVTSGSIKDILESEHTKERYLGDQFFAEISTRFLHS